jgi:hypothetical protein
LGRPEKRREAEGTDNAPLVGNPLDIIKDFATDLKEKKTLRFE